MKIHAASTSASVTRTLEQAILASGHSITPAGEAELVLFDQKHPPKNAFSAPRLTLGDAKGDGESIPTPIAPRQLVRLLKNRAAAQPLLLAHGWQVDLSARALTHDAIPRSALTEKEAALLATLRTAYPEPVTHQGLLTDVWGVRAGVDTHTLETHIYRLRNKLEALEPRPCDIVTANGTYKLVIDR